MKKRLFLAVCLALMLLPGLFGARAAVKLPEGYRAIVENERFIVGLNTKNCFFCVADKALGQVYGSNPDKWKSDLLAQGGNRMRLQSQLIITVKNELSGNTETVNSQTGSVSKGTVKLLKLENGLCIKYTFESYGITVPLYVTIGEETFDISVPIEEVVEEGADRLLSIDISPMFAAAPLGAEGYILIPDGSGSLIRFDGGKGSAGSYRAQVYGSDKNFLGTVNYATALDARFPLFGLNYGDHGLLAVAAAGDAHAYVNAQAAGGTTSYNAAWFSFTVRAAGEYTIGEENYNSRTINLYQEALAWAGDCRVTWYPLPAGECDYIAMARRYQALLFGEKEALPARPGVKLTLYGMIRKNVPLLGIPVEQSVALTEYADAQGMLLDMRDQGIPVTMEYYNWSDAAARDDYGAAQPSGTLGGKKAFGALTRAARENESALYVTQNLLTFSADGAFLSRFTKAASQLSSYPVKIRTYAMSTRKALDSAPAWYALRPDAVAAQAEALNDDLRKLDVSCSLGDAGCLLYSDFSRPDGGRDVLLESVKDAYARASQDMKVLATAPNAYALQALSYVSDVPDSGSGFTIAEESVPFYAYVLRGKVPGSTAPLNLSDEPRAVLLYAMETGLDLNFAVVARNMDELRFSDAKELYACDYAAQREDISALFAELNAVRAVTDGKAILSRETDGPVVTVTYADGGRLLVNYSAMERAGDFGTLAPWGYLWIAAEG